MIRRIRTLLLPLAALACLCPWATAETPAHDQFRVAVYIPVSVVEQMKDPAWLEESWDAISSQVKIDKVYIETYRGRVIADDGLLENVKKFFAAHGVQVAGGIAYAAAAMPAVNGPVRLLLLHRPRSIATM